MIFFEARGKEGGKMTFQAVLQEMAAIHKAKNSDYGDSYKLSARLLGRPVVEGLLHRMCDKLSRAWNLVLSCINQRYD